MVLQPHRPLDVRDSSAFTICRDSPTASKRPWGQLEAGGNAQGSKDLVPPVSKHCRAARKELVPPVQISPSRRYKSSLKFIQGHGSMLNSSTSASGLRLAENDVKASIIPKQVPGSKEIAPEGREDFAYAAATSKAEECSTGPGIPTPRDSNRDHSSDDWLRHRNPMFSRCKPLPLGQQVPRWPNAVSYTREDMLSMRQQLAEFL